MVVNPCIKGFVEGTCQALININESVIKCDVGKWLQNEPTCHTILYLSHDNVGN